MQRPSNFAFGYETPLAHGDAEKMDRRFCDRLRKAIERGEELAPTAVSPASCTRHPVYCILVPSEVTSSF
jgi:hypothetical protein